MCNRLALLLSSLVEHGAVGVHKKKEQKSMNVFADKHQATRHQLHWPALSWGRVAQNREVLLDCMTDSQTVRLSRLYR